MQLGIIGLGKMGGNMRERLRRAGHTVIGYDRNPDLSDVASTEELVAALTESPRAVWVMVPDKVVSSVVSSVGALLAEGDIVIDGGNTKWREDTVHADQLGARGVHFVDCGVSGGVWGLDNGYALMVGGDDADVAQLMPIFDALKPPGEFGFVHAGAPIDPGLPSGATCRGACGGDCPASCTPAVTAPGTSPRWCTTASSTESCRPTPRAGSCWNGPVR